MLKSTNLVNNAIALLKVFSVDVTYSMIEFFSRNLKFYLLIVDIAVKFGGEGK